jgi:hypothetical protein
LAKSKRKRAPVRRRRKSTPRNRAERKLRQPPKPHRRLRVYALDPSIGKKLDSIMVNETTLSVEWEEDLQHGPVGEYLEVVDVDPASDRIYDPVDLTTR